MRRVVVTGMGIVSSIGNNTQEVLASLREGKSGIVRAEKYAELEKLEQRIVPGRVLPPRRVPKETCRGAQVQ